MIPSSSLTSSLRSTGVIFVLMTVILISNLVSYSIAAPVVSKTTQAQVSQQMIIFTFCFYASMGSVESARSDLHFLRKFYNKQ